MSASMKKLAIFDMDGTLLDTLEDLARSCNHTLEQFGYPLHDTQQYKAFVGNGARKLVERMLPADSRSPRRVEEVLTAYRAYYAQHSTDCTKPYPGIEQAVQELRKAGVKLGIVSNKPHSDTVQLAALYFGEGTFDLVYGAMEGVPVKPDPTAVEKMMAVVGVTPEETAYFGDSGVDMLTGKAAGAWTVGVLWGFRTKEELESSGADSTIAKPEEIVGQVQN